MAQGPDSGTSRLTEDSPEAEWAQQTKAITEVVFQKFRNDGLTAQAEASQRSKTGDTDRALEILQEYLSIVADSKEPGSKALLTRPAGGAWNSTRRSRAQKEARPNRPGTRR